MTEKPVAESPKLLREDADARLRQRLHGIADHSIRGVIDRLVDEAAFDLQMRPPTLTDAEREAIADAAGRYVEGITPKAQEYTVTLRGLLDRLG